MKATILSSFLLLSLSLAVACGSDDRSDADTTKSETAPASANACEAAGTMLCARACACATDGKCRLGVSTASGNAAVNFENERACLDLYVVLGCAGGGEPGFDYARCEEAIDTACVDTAGGRGALLPSECNVSGR